ncbi:MAG: ABC transporter ATP-binding protein, partial [Verrucomicrobiaceae bacterium]
MSAKPASGSCVYELKDVRKVYDDGSVQALRG